MVFLFDCAILFILVPQGCFIGRGIIVSMLLRVFETLRAGGLHIIILISLGCFPLFLEKSRAKDQG